MLEPNGDQDPSCGTYSAGLRCWGRANDRPKDEVLDNHEVLDRPSHR